MSSLSQHKLKNGMLVITDRIPEHHSVCVKLWVKSGSRSETKNNNGIAHFLEHMAFKGTKTRSALQIAKEFDELGGHFNACTGREYTIYYIKVLKEFVQKGIEILSDILLNSVFEKEEIEREKSVVLEEINQTEDTPEEIIFDKFFEATYPDHPFGRPILGTKEIVSSFSSKDLKDFVAQHYFAENMLLIASGGVDHEFIVQQATNYLSNLQQKSTPESIKDKSKPSYFCANFRQNKKLEQSHILLGFPCFSYQESLKKVYSAKILAVIFGGSMSSRLFQEVREKRGLAYSVSAFCSASLDCGVFGMYSSTDPKKLKTLVNVILEQINKLSCHGILDEELFRAKNQIKASLLMGMENNESRASYIGKCFQNFERCVTQEEAVSIVDSLNKDDIDLSIDDILCKKELSLAAIGQTDSLPDQNELLNSLNI